MMVYAASVGRWVLDGIVSAGRGTVLLLEILRQTAGIWRLKRETAEQMHVVVVGSLPLVVTTSIFVGAVTAVQAVYQMQAYVPMKFLGTVISKSVFIELGPVLTALVVGGRLCANYAAELGTMKVTEQIEAMEMVAIDPVYYLAMPRFWGSVLMLPVLTVFANTISIVAGFVISVATLDITSSTFIEGLRMFFRTSDVVGGLVKTFFFGGIVAMAGIYNGFNAHGGATGVGRATMTAVVGSSLSILAADYILAVALFQVLFPK